MKWIELTGCLLFAGLLWQPTYAQDNDPDPEGPSIEYFRKLALEDAIKEQKLKLVSEEDQTDYWADQRNFEKELKKINYTAYTVYLHTKAGVYEAHGTVCDSQCGHGRHYWLQAGYYGRYADSALPSAVTAVRVDKP